MIPIAGVIVFFAFWNSELASIVAPSLSSFMWIDGTGINFGTASLQRRGKALAVPIATVTAMDASIYLVGQRGLIGRESRSSTKAAPSSVTGTVCWDYSARLWGRSIAIDQSSVPFEPFLNVNLMVTDLAKGEAAIVTTDLKLPSTHTCVGKFANGRLLVINDTQPSAQSRLVDEC